MYKFLKLKSISFVFCMISYQNLMLPQCMDNASKMIYIYIYIYNIYIYIYYIHTYTYKFVDQHLYTCTLCQWGFEYTFVSPAEREDPIHKRGGGCTGYDTKIYLMIRLLFWSSGECEITLHCHYSQVHSDLEWWYLLGSHLWVK